jgi:hypothetical protein
VRGRAGGGYLMSEDWDPLSLPLLCFLEKSEWVFIKNHRAE